MNTTHSRWVALLLLGVSGWMIGLSACTLPANDAPELDRSANFTQAAQTLDAQLTLAAQGAFPTVTPLSSQEGTAIPVITPTRPGDPPPEVTAAEGAPCDRGKFIEDVSIPDGTVFKPGETFVKTWRIENTGSCTWTADYTVVFDSGDAMSGPASFPLTQTSVPPESVVEISINLTAPETPGSYRGDWLLRNSAGQTFGLGSLAEASFWVVINVEDKPVISVLFDAVHDCDGRPTAVFRLDNDGTSFLESIRITLTNLDSGQTLFGPFNSNGPFMGAASECPPGGDAVDPGDTAYVGGRLDGSPETGDMIEAVFTVCSLDNLAGACTEETIEFQVP